MLIKQAVLRQIASGEIELVFRRWRRATVKTGGQLKTSVGVLAIDGVEPVAMAKLTVGDAKRGGYASRKALIDSLRGRDGTVYRIAVRLAGPDPRLALRDATIDSADELAKLATELERIDRASRDGAWTMKYLQLIAERPATLAEDLAASIGTTKRKFKPRVRRLKELGLTLSLDKGYRLSKRGASFLEQGS